MTTEFKIEWSTLDLLDPDAKKDFLGAIGLLSSQSAGLLRWRGAAGVPLTGSRRSAPGRVRVELL